MLLLIDNRDSFTFNLVQAFRSLGEEVQVRPAAGLEIDAVERLGPDRIVIGPGPGRPETAGTTLEILGAFAGRRPILGVCLGHQAIAVHLGGRLEPSSSLKHGQTTQVSHGGTGLFRGLPSPLVQTRYNSLTVAEASLPDELRVTARDGNGEVMAIEHRHWPLAGLQFHPEAIRSRGGMALLDHFVAGKRHGPEPAAQGEARKKADKILPTLRFF